MVYFNEAQKEGQMSAKGGQKEGFPGQCPKSRAKEGHGRAPCQKQGALPKAGQFGSYANNPLGLANNSKKHFLKYILDPLPYPFYKVKRKVKLFKRMGPGLDKHIHYTIISISIIIEKLRAKFASIILLPVFSIIGIFQNNKNFGLDNMIIFLNVKTILFEQESNSNKSMKRNESKLNQVLIRSNYYIKLYII